ASGGRIMRGSWRFVVAIGFVAMMLGGSGSVEAFIDDMEEDAWLPFTHFHLGDRASAGYASGIARSGTRAFHVDIWGWTVRDFGSAYGYAMYATRKAPITELRVSILYDRLEDVVTSPWDAYAAGVSLDLLDASYHSLGRLRYITSYRASSNAGRCAPTTSDVVLPAPSALGVWTDLGRNPTADGLLASAAIDVQTSHPHLEDVSVELTVSGSTGPHTQLLWDPGFHVRGAAILTPSYGSAVRGMVEVRGRVLPGLSSVHLHVDDGRVATAEVDQTNGFAIPWDSDAWPEGSHRLVVIADSPEGGGSAARSSREVIVFIDRTAPELSILHPSNADTLTGLATIEADVFDGQGVSAVEQIG